MSMFASSPVRITATRPSRSWAEGLAAVARRVVLWPSHVLQARAELAKLGQLTDFELRDIGLSRHDLRNATALPLDSDPTTFLARAALQAVETPWQQARR